MAGWDPAAGTRQHVALFAPGRDTVARTPVGKHGSSGCASAGHPAPPHDAQGHLAGTTHARPRRADPLPGVENPGRLDCHVLRPGRPEVADDIGDEIAREQALHEWRNLEITAV